jgi:hypothetical protein
LVAARTPAEKPPGGRTWRHERRLSNDGSAARARLMSAFDAMRRLVGSSKGSGRLPSPCHRGRLARRAAAMSVNLIADSGVYAAAAQEGPQHQLVRTMRRRTRLHSLCRRPCDSSKQLGSKRQQRHQLLSLW